MKKILLSVLAACAVTGASASMTDLTKTWSTTVDGIFTADARVFAAEAAIDGEGNLIATGGFTGDATIAGTEMSAIGTSAYIAKYDKTGAPAWAVALTGAATITSVVTDAEGNIFAAGSFADEVVFNTTAGVPVTKHGMTVGGDPTEKQNAAFIAKYNAAGELIAVKAFIPAIHEESGESYYDYQDGDVNFKIKEILPVGDKLYVAAVYNGKTDYYGLDFSAPFVSYVGFMFMDVKATSIFTVSASDLDPQDILITAKYTGNNNDEVYDTSESWSVAFDVKDEQLFAAFGVAGSVGLFVAGDTTVVSEEGQNFVFATASAADGTIATTVTKKLALATELSDNSFAKVSFDGSKATVAGNIFTSVEEGGATVDYKNVFVASVTPGEQPTPVTFEGTDGNILYSQITSAAILDGGEVILSLAGEYNSGSDKGKFAEAVKTIVFADNEFAPYAEVSDAYGVAANGAYAAFAQVGETGVTYSLYTDASAGIADITVDNTDAPAEYFNLQGVRVVDPANGLYIVRQGDKVSKVAIR